MGSSKIKFLDNYNFPKRTTRLWLVRHAIVEENARKTLYGTTNVPISQKRVIADAAIYKALAKKLPRKALWFVTPLARTQDTAILIQKAGYGEVPLIIEKGFTEQSVGIWCNCSYEALSKLQLQKPHPFWYSSTTERPEGGESMLDVCARVADSMERLATKHPHKDMIIISHGAVIRAALAHSLEIHPSKALHFSVQNLSLTVLEYVKGMWKVVCVNALLGL